MILQSLWARARSSGSTLISLPCFRQGAKAPFGFPSFRRKKYIFMGKTRGKAQAFPFVVVCGVNIYPSSDMLSLSIIKPPLRFYERAKKPWTVFRTRAKKTLLSFFTHAPRGKALKRCTIGVSEKPPAVKKSLQFWRMCGILILLKAVKGKVGFLLRPKRESAATAESAFGGKNARSSPRSRAAENYK